MINTTIGELNNAASALNKLLINSELAANIKIRLARLGKAIEAESKAAHEQRLELFRKHGKPIEGTQDWTLEGAVPEAVAALNASWEAVLAEPVELPGQKIAFEVLAGAPLNAADLMALEWLLIIKDETDVNEAPLIANTAAA